MKLEFDATSKVEIEMVRKMFADVAFDLETPARQDHTEVDNRVKVPELPTAGAEAVAAAIPAPPTLEEVAKPADHLDTHTTAAADGPDTDGGDPGATPAPERDKHGRVWDERIDSSNKKQTTAGEWMKRKNVDDAMRQQVMAELTAADTAAPADVFAGTVADTAAPVVPDAPVVDVNAPPPVPPVAGAAVANGPDWGSVFTRTMEAKSAELLTDEQIEAWITQNGIVGGFPALIARPELFEKFLIELSIA